MSDGRSTHDRSSGLPDAIHRAVMFLMTEVPIPPKTFRIKHAINTHKFLCAPVIAGLMYLYGETSTAAYLYLVIHGSYGWTWLIKDQAFPDASWEQRATFGSFLTLIVLLGAFWITPFLLIAMGPAPSNPVMALALTSFIFGMFCLHVSDAQKHFTLRQERQLIDDGMFARTRNPNYFGEILIYSGFALMASATPSWWVPWAVNLLVWTVLFVPNWLRKDRSLSRYPNWERYRQQTGMVLPQLVETSPSETDGE